MIGADKGTLALALGIINRSQTIFYQLSGADFIGVQATIKSFNICVMTKLCLGDDKNASAFFNDIDVLTLPPLAPDSDGNGRAV